LNVAPVDPSVVGKGVGACTRFAVDRGKFSFGSEKRASRRRRRGKWTWNFNKIIL